MDRNGYPHWSFNSVGQVGTRVLRWNGVTEDFQEDCYHVPDIVRDEFQSVQGQVAWVARRGQDTSDHLAFVEYDNLTALDSVSRPKDSSEVLGFRLERVLS